jgi:UPF0755 protein
VTMPTDELLEPMPPERRRRPRWLVLVLIVVVLAAGTLYGTFSYVSGAISPGGEAGETVTVTIPKGSSTEQIGKQLEKAGIIKNARIFSYWTKIEGKGPYQAGDFTLKKLSGYDEVASLLSKTPDPKFARLQIPEGLTIAQIADRITKLQRPAGEKPLDGNLFKTLATNGTITSPLQAPGVKTLEGLVFPATYEVGHSDDERRILQKMVDAMVSVTQGTNLTQRAPEHGMTPFQILTVASMIEREAKIDEDRGLVAQVIYNRLDKKMRLQIDATVLYALPPGKTRLTNEDLKVKSPYNTYEVAGLPPGPIAAPGKKAIQAALDPTPGTFLYYVVIDKDGRHAFANTLAEHQANIKKAQAAGVQ